MRQIIERQTAFMSRMINDMLEVSRLARGNIEIRPVVLDLIEVVRNTTEQWRQTIGPEKISVNLVHSQHPVHVSGDPARLAQVLTHLLQNASKFTESNGEVIVSVDSDSDRQLAIVKVRDTGIGMSPETLAHIFQPFSRSNPEHNRRGLGLGLALVKGLVELHGGKVSAASPGVGQGAEFTIELPLVLPRHESAPSSSSEASGPQALRILIIDDQRDASYPLRKLLELDGHRVEVAPDGPTGLEAASHFRPQVVLCDIGLPGTMNGFDVAQALRTDPRSSSAVLVAVTGYGQDEHRRQSAAAGFDRHLTKPVGQLELRRLLSDVTFQCSG
jgi:CheY-like chemotaxis protein